MGLFRDRSERVDGSLIIGRYESESDFSERGDIRQLKKFDNPSFLQGSVNLIINAWSIKALQHNRGGHL
jgi:hypothetical protein